jgi:hypothetical protein
MHNLRIKICLDSARALRFLAEALSEKPYLSQSVIHYLNREQECLSLADYREPRQDIDEDTDVLEYKEVG